MSDTVHMSSQLGALRLTSEDGQLTKIEFRGELDETALPRRPEKASVPVLRLAIEQLDAYFVGELREFDIPLRPEGTSFQRATWKALRQIPYGETISYGDLARSIGKPDAVRAVGAANGRNPIPIVIPCHRVIGSDGTLTGYGGGLERKRYLLDLEGGREPTLF